MTVTGKKLISYEAFGRFRLSHFLRNIPATRNPKDRGAGRRFRRKEIAEVEGWEYLGRVWVGEAFGFTEWLRLSGDPDVLRSISLALTDLPAKGVQTILDALGFPLKPAMRLPAIQKILGNPVAVEARLSDRKTYTFRFGTREVYELRCTLLTAERLIYLTMMRVAWSRTFGSDSCGRVKSDSDCDLAG